MSSERQNEPAAPGWTLPGIVATGALAVYLITLNRWISPANSGLVMQATGWSHVLPYMQPLLYVVTLPLQWLPVTWTPFLLNALNAVLAAATIGLLVRSVMLLPHDRTRHQRYCLRSSGAFLKIPQAWLPPVLAALACGLELTFWRNSVSATGEMIDLLVFAYLIRCLLEFRVERNDSWLLRFAFVYGLGVTNNYALIGLFPPFLVALVWIKGLEFLNTQFLARTTLVGLAGLCSYLVLPLVHVASDLSDASFWMTLKGNLATQRAYLLDIWFQPNRRAYLLVVGLASVFPVLFLGIRWVSRTGDTSVVGLWLNDLLMPFVHLFYFVLASVASVYSAYHFLQKEDGLPAYLTMLTAYYLGALSLGYFAGYLLLVFGSAEKRSPGQGIPVPAIIYPALRGLVWLALFLVPAGLVYRNIGKVRAENSPALKEFARRTIEALPPGRGVALCDDPRRLAVLLGELARTGRSEDWLVLNTRLLELASYSRYLHRVHPEIWPVLPEQTPAPAYVSQGWLLETVASIATNLPTYYLHPSFGYYSEAMYLEPGALVHKFTRYVSDSLTPPPAAPRQIARVQDSWRELEQAVLRPLVERIKAGEQSALLAGSFYSRSMDWWGVELQQSGQLEAAHAAFQLALDLNPGSEVAKINLAFNEQLRQGRSNSTDSTKEKAEQMRRSGISLEPLMNEQGPVDEPSLCLVTGQIMFRGNLVRQAGQQFIRTAQLRPDDSEPRQMLAQLYLAAGRPALTVDTVHVVLSQPERFNLAPSKRIEFARLEIGAQMLAGATNEVERLLAVMYEQGRKDPAALVAVMSARMTQGRTADALRLNDELLQLRPDDPDFLLNKSFLLMQPELNRAQEALPLLNSLVSKSSQNALARFNRAIVNLQLSNYAAARSDYEVLLKEYPKLARVHYGLGEIGNRTTNRELALKHYRLYLEYAPEGPEAAEVQKKVKALEAAK